MFLFLFLTVDQRTQLIECDLGGSSSSALSRPLARSPQSVGVIKGAHSSSKKKKRSGSKAPFHHRRVLGAGRRAPRLPTGRWFVTDPMASV